MNRTEEFLDLVERLNGAAKLMETTGRVASFLEKGREPRIEIVIRLENGNTMTTLDAGDLTPDIGKEILESIVKAHEFWTEQLQEIAAELIDKDTTKDEGPQADPEHGPIEQWESKALKQDGPAPEL